MLLTRLSATGLAVPVDLDGMEALTRLPAAPVAACIADALTLWRAGLLGADAAVVLTELRWGVSVPDLDLDLDLDLPTEPTYDVWDVDDDQIAPVLAVGADEVHVDVSLAPDPPLYGRLREHAVRDPRLVTALGQEAQLHVKVGLRRLRGAGTVTLDLLGARIGDVAFPVVGKEKPVWLQTFLAEVGRRIRRVALSDPPPVHELLVAGLARAPERHAEWLRVQRSLADDFGLPEPRLVLDPQHPDLVFGDEAWPSRLLGREGREALHLAAACYLEPPDVLVVPDAVTESVAAWLKARTDGDVATLEQVLVS